MTHQENSLVESISMTDAISMADAIATVAQPLRRATVQVRSRRHGAGAGVIWSADGVIITNAHVVNGSKATVELADGQVLEASVTARNRQRDLVALKVAAIDLPVATIGDASQLRVGELVLAVGNPWGVTGALTTGIIHSVKPHHASQHWIQADIQLAPGNSGGPLANAQGEVIGINTMIVNGRGFAVPSHVVQQFLSQRHDEPYLGVTLQPVRVQGQRRMAIGLLLTGIEADSSAATAHLQPGDVVVGIRGHCFQTPNELFHVLANSYVGDSLPLDILRDRQPLIVEVVLCSKTPQPQAA